MRFVQALVVPSLFLAFRLSGQNVGSDLACLFVLCFFCAVFVAVFRDSYTTISGLKRFLCDAVFLNHGSIFHRMCRGTTSSIIVAAIVSLLLSASLLVFAYIVYIEFFVFLFALPFVHQWLTVRLQRPLKSNLQPGATAVSHRFVASSFLVLLLLVEYVFVWLVVPVPAIDFTDPEIFGFVETVEHQCNTFQDLARTFFFFDLAALTIGNIDAVTGWLSLIIQATSVSLAPLIAYVMCIRVVNDTQLDMR